MTNLNNTLSISNEVLEEILLLADKLEVYCECFEGSLQDNYILYDADNISIGGDSAKYIIIKERFLNAWSSELVLVFTDNEKEVMQFEELFEKEV